VPRTSSMRGRELSLFATGTFHRSRSLDRGPAAKSVTIPRVCLVYRRRRDALITWSPSGLDLEPPRGRFRLGPDRRATSQIGSRSRPAPATLCRSSRSAGDRVWAGVRRHDALRARRKRSTHRGSEPARSEALADHDLTAPGARRRRSPRTREDARRVSGLRARHSARRRASSSSGTSMFEAARGTSTVITSRRGRSSTGAVRASARCARPQPGVPPRTAAGGSTRIWRPSSAPDSDA